jgi:hypothetical protein
MDQTVFTIFWYKMNGWLPWVVVGWSRCHTRNLLVRFGKSAERQNGRPTQIC